MYLKHLSLVNFKNYKVLEVDLSPRINCFFGLNGVGKTNVLDAIYYLSFCKSNFNSIDSENIRHEDEFFVIQGQYIGNDDVEENIYCGVKRSHKKQFKRNKKDYQKLSDHIGLVPLVMVSPSDINLITGGSEERRKFIDSVISQYDKNYLENLIQYNKVLKHRNSLLKNFAETKKVDHVSVEVWNEQLIRYGLDIYNERIKFIKDLIPVFQKYYDYIAKETEKVELIYHSQLHESDFASELAKTLEKDIILGYTTVGIHKDDLVLNLSGFPIKKTGSQGQQKTYLVALKLAEFDFLKLINGYKPVLLLDDIFDKLDPERVSQIINLVADNHFGQIFITDKSKESILNILNDIPIESSLFEVANGEINIVNFQ